jgi:hypothetical protein
LEKVHPSDTLLLFSQPFLLSFFLDSLQHGH